MNAKKKVVLGVLLLASFIVGLAAMPVQEAQADTVDSGLGGLRTISVTVLDADSGLALNGALVTLLSQATGNAIAATTSDVNGSASFTGVLSGLYEVQCEINDYYTDTKEVQVLLANMTLQFDMEPDFLNEPTSTTNLTYAAAGVGGLLLVGGALGAIKIKKRY